MTYSPLDQALDETPYALQEHLGFELTHWDVDFARLEQPIGPHLMNPCWDSAWRHLCHVAGHGDGVRRLLHCGCGP